VAGLAILHIPHRQNWPLCHSIQIIRHLKVSSLQIAAKPEGISSSPQLSTKQKNNESAKST